MQITTITPARYPFSVKSGVNEFSETYASLVQKLSSVSGKGQLSTPDWHVPNNSTAKDSLCAYSDITIDDCDIRLGFWQGITQEGHEITIHCFNNELAIFEVNLTPGKEVTQNELKDWSEKETRKAIFEFSETKFIEIHEAHRLANLANLLTGNK